MTGSVRKRSVTIAGHTTSVSLEAPFWAALRALAAGRGRSLNALVAEIDAARLSEETVGDAGPTGNLSSALRVFVLRCYQSGEIAGPPLED